MIQTVGVSKRFEDVQAVNSLSMEIHQGEVFGLVGTNGAGKSTLLRMLCGILRQDEGSIAVDGQPVYENEAAKQEIFYISDDSYYFTGVNSRSITSVAKIPFTAWRITGSRPSNVSSHNRYLVLAQIPKMALSCFFIPFEKVRIFRFLSRPN